MAHRLRAGDAEIMEMIFQPACMYNFHFPVRACIRLALPDGNLENRLRTAFSHSA